MALLITLFKLKNIDYTHSAANKYIVTADSLIRDIFSLVIQVFDVSSMFVLQCVQNCSIMILPLFWGNVLLVASTCNDYNPNTAPLGVSPLIFVLHHKPDVSDRNPSSFSSGSGFDLAPVAVFTHDLHELSGHSSVVIALPHM